MNVYDFTLSSLYENGTIIICMPFTVLGYEVRGKIRAWIKYLKSVVIVLQMYVFRSNARDRKSVV